MPWSRFVTRSDDRASRTERPELGARGETARDADASSDGRGAPSASEVAEAFALRVGWAPDRCG